MEIKAADVMKLRKMTGAGMMDCKKALTETDGDMDKAVEYLREKGLAKAAKKAGRIAAEGVSYALVENGVGALVEVNCETDFCAKSAPFVAFVKDIAKVVADNDPADVDALMNCKYPGTELTVSETMPEKVMSIGENLQIRRFVRFAENTSVGYVHAGGKIGVLVNLAVEGGVDAVDGGRGEAGTLAWAGIEPAALLERLVKRSQIRRRDLGKFLLPQIGLDMVIKITVVLFQGAEPDGERHLLQPAVQPLCQRHSALLRQVHTLIGVDILSEFGGQFLLRVGVDIPENGVAVCLVAHHDAALPAAILPFPHHAVPGRPALCHAAHLQSLSLICGVISEWLT